jgi:hypothetical protein
VPPFALGPGYGQDIKPPPIDMLPPPPVARRDPPRVPQHMTRDEEGEWIISHGEAFCRKYPDDRVCYPAPSESSP